MPPTAILVAIIALVVIVGLYFATRKKPELPSETSSESKPSEGKSAESPRRSAEPTRPTKTAPAESADDKPSDDSAAVAKEASDDASSDDSEEGASPAAAKDDKAAAKEAEEPPPPPAAGERQEASEEDRAAIKESLAGTRGGFIKRLAGLFRRKKEIDPELLDEIEEVLITADLGVATTQKFLEALRERLERNELGDVDAVWTALRDLGNEMLSDSVGGLALPQAQPAVVLVVGVNGVGKTTTIGKLAARYTSEGKKVLLAAGDTYRAAATMQLNAWARRAKADIHKGRDRADPSSVIFDAIKKGVDEEYDIVICDTAGRLHTKTPLMDEIAKVGRSVEKALGRTADEVLLVLDATTGQNALQQAAQFGEALPISGVALTKLDGTAKGGVVLAIVDQHGFPVRFVGVGEKMEDLRIFDAPTFIETLFAKPDPADVAGDDEEEEADGDSSTSEGDGESAAAD